MLFKKAKEITLNYFTYFCPILQTKGKGETSLGGGWLKNPKVTKNQTILTNCNLGSRSMIYRNYMEAFFWVNQLPDFVANIFAFMLYFRIHMYNFNEFSFFIFFFNLQTGLNEWITVLKTERLEREKDWERTNCCERNSFSKI